MVLEGKETHLRRALETSQKTLILAREFGVETEAVRILACWLVDPRLATHAFSASSENNPRWLSRWPEP
jgi:hypothetical protein